MTSGERDLDVMLASLDVEQRPGAFSFVVGGSAALVAQAHAIVEETEGRTLVVPTSAARDAGAAVEASWVWLTLTVHSSLEAVGLTAAFSAALAEVNIPCNVIAGAHHDHLLVPEDRTEDAIRALRSLCASN